MVEVARAGWVRIAVEFELPEEVTYLLGDTPEEIAAKAKTIYVMDILRGEIIDPMIAGEILGVSPPRMDSLMTKYQVDMSSNPPPTVK